MKNFKKENIDYSVYLCTDWNLMSTETLEEAVEQAIEGGATVIQLREKKCSSKDFYETAVRIKKVTTKHSIPLIINDRVDIALAVDAEGVHVGQDDLPVQAVRSVIGKDKILGVSARNREQAVKAYRDGADYLGVGAMFPTSTKKDARVITKDELVEIRQSVPIPIVAIGGVKETNVMELKGTGIDGVAVVSAIIAKEEIKEAAKNLRRLVGEMKK